ncbi:hypothetical protein SGGMMB4_05877 (plasmid) [Sodalis glossinidius str. 'morsitans']|uniref:Large polyvalent protein-associated domain-containing protein n=1 Tax=Sodalis glossinidius (strain morsitans) TaxID=343509 RepID=A0A193QP23_SODGM|nr:LPD7 domain-containing protein [Sodalis glossinidius]CRL46907.1 hypothetical protein SGGMMB4_05877 [Sodalis glossinidius str. 'morsitans']
MCIIWIRKLTETLFIDIGKAIVVRKSAMTASAVEIALALAKEKFGSTLTIKGARHLKTRLLRWLPKKSGYLFHQ